MVAFGAKVGVRNPDGTIEDGTPEGLQADGENVYMTVRMSDKSLKRIIPPKGWSYNSDTGWKYDGTM